VSRAERGSAWRRLRLLAGFAALWVLVGYPLGTLTLLGPVRWATDALRAREAAAAMPEKVVVRAFILLLAGVSGWIAWKLLGVVRRTEEDLVKVFIPVGCGLATLASLWVWFHPAWLIPTREVPPPSAQFTFGPYPTGRMLRALERQGYTAVVPLMHPAVVPFEPRLLGEEREEAREAGIPLIEVPMLPWVSSNADAARTLDSLARARPDARFYVHCYLGRDRVHVAAQIVRQAGATTAFLSGKMPERLALTDTLRLERGPVREPLDSVFVGPLPTREEWMGYLLGGQVRSVVSLLDPSDPADSSRLETERRALAREGIVLRVVAPDAPGLADTIRGLPRPVYVHAFGSSDDDARRLVDELSREAGSP